MNSSGPVDRLQSTRQGNFVFHKCVNACSPATTRVNHI